MDLARVVGTVVSTVKDPRLEGLKLLLIRPVDAEGQATGEVMIGLDAVGAGSGETVFYVTGKEASFAFLPRIVPADVSVVAIVDRRPRQPEPTVILARVVGTVVASHKHPKFEACSLLLVQPVDADGADAGDELIAVDSVGTGAGETVLVVQEGRSTSLAMGTDLAPANAAIIGVVDHVDPN